MVRARPALGLAVLLAGCGDTAANAAGDAPFDERCGVAGPIRLLPLDEHEIATARQLVAFEDRYLVGVLEFANPVQDVFEADAGTIDDERVAERIVSFQECGEGEPIVVAEGVYQVIVPPEPDMPWLGCNPETEKLVAFDPTGAEPAIDLGTAEFCWVVFEPSSLVLKRRPHEVYGPSDVVRLDLSTAPPTQTLIEPELTQAWPESTRTAPNSVTGLTPQLDLIKIELDTGDRSVLRQGVAQYGWAFGEDLLALSSDGDPNNPFLERGLWTLWDPTTDQEWPLGGPDWELATAWVREGGIATTRETEDATDTLETEIRLFSSLDAPVVLEGDWELHAVDDTGKAVIGTHDAVDGTGGFFVLDPGESTPRLLTDKYVYYGGWLDGDAYYFYDPVHLTWEFPPTDEQRTRLTRTWLDGSGTETLSGDVFQPLRLSDSRFVTVRDHANDYHGVLVLSTPDAEYELDDDAYLFSARYNAAPVSGAMYDSDTFVYGVRDARLERIGLWSVTLKGN